MHVRAVAPFLVACALAALAGVPLATSADASAPRSAQATPATNLGDEVVRVTWQNFRPTRADGAYSVAVLECIAHPTSVLRDCNVNETYPLSLTGNQAQGTTQKDGTGRVFMDIDDRAAPIPRVQRDEAVLVAVVREHTKRLRSEQVAARTRLGAAVVPQELG